MFYEEKVVKGKLCWRITPDGKWRECTKEQLTKRIVEMESGRPSDMNEKS